MSHDVVQCRAMTCNVLGMTQTSTLDAYIALAVAARTGETIAARAAANRKAEAFARKHGIDEMAAEAAVLAIVCAL
jgi:hypothetical protein